MIGDPIYGTIYPTDPEVIVPYPVGSDVAAAWTALGLAVPEGTDWDAEVAGAVAELEERTGFTPFRNLAENESGDLSDPRNFGFRYFTLQESSRLDLRGGILLDLAVVVDGVALVDGTDFYGVQRDPMGPVREIHFTTLTCSRQNGVAVSGRWGCVTSLPRTVWDALIKKAMANVLQVALGPSGAVIREKAGPVEYDYAEAGSLLKAWTAKFDDACDRYRRTSL